MASINTNSSALTALQNLSMSQKAMGKVQSEISTGLKVSSAADNASYWSIATQMTSDKGVLSTVQDSLATNSALLKTTNASLNTVIKTVGDIKSQLTLAKSVTNGDYSTINESLKQLGETLKDAIKGASFNGQNLLDGSITSNALKIVSGFHQAQSGSSTVATIDTIDISLKAVFTAQANSVTTKGADITAAATVAELVTLGGSGATKLVDPNAASGYADVAVTAADGITPPTIKVTSVDKNGVTTETTYGGMLDATHVSQDDFSDAARFTVSTKVTKPQTGSTTGDLLVGKVGASTNVTDLTQLGNGVVNNFGGALTSTSDIDTIMKNVDESLKTVRSFAATLGSVQTRIDTQVDFNGSLKDALTQGISALVDADMNDASARLQALQTKQQLGVQSLSIANQNAQLILQLFRG